MSDFNKEFSVSFSADLKALKDSMSKVSKTVSKTMEDVEKEVSGLSKGFENLSKDTKKSSKKMADSFDDAVDDMKQDAKKGAKKIADEMEDSAKDSEKAFEKMGDGIKNVFKTIVGAVALDGLIDGMNNLCDVAIETQTSMNKIATSFANVGASAKVGEDAYRGLYKLLGDSDQATETAQLMSKIADSEKEVAEWTKICTGVFAEYGDALPIEGLIEAVNETAKVGKVTGTLADALNWAGISEDAFNDKLAKCRTETERLDLIQGALNGKYEKSAELYEKNNAKIMEYRDSQSKLNTVISNLGDKLLPVKTSLMDIASYLLGNFSGAIGQAFDKFAEKIQQVEDYIKTPEFQELVTTMQEFGSTVGDTVVTAWTELKDRVFEIYDKFSDESATKNLTDLAKDLTTGFEGLNKFLSGDSFFKDLLIDGALLTGTMAGLGKVGNFVNDNLLDPLRKLKDTISIKYKGSWLENLMDLTKQSTKVTPDLSPDDYFSAIEIANLPDATPSEKMMGNVANNVNMANAFDEKPIGKFKLAFKSLGDTLKGFKGTGGIMGAIGSIASVPHIGLIIAGVVALAGAFILLWKKSEKFREAISSIWESLKTFGEFVWNIIKESVIVVFNEFKDVAISIWENLKSVWESLQGLFEDIFGFIGYIFEDFNLSLSGSGDTASTFGDIVVGVIKWIAENVGKHLKTVFGFISWVVKMIITVLRMMWMVIEPILKIVWELIKIIVDAVLKYIGFIVDGIKWLVDKIKSAASDSESSFGKFINLVKDLWEKVKKWGGNIVDFFVNLPETIASGFEAGKKFIHDAFANVFNKAIDGVCAGVNFIISGINWVLEKIGVDPLGEWDASKHHIELLAKGTSSWKGGNAIVGEAGRELVSFPNGTTFLANSPMFLDLPVGSTVLRNSKTEKLLNSMGIGMYAKGKNEGWFNSALSWGKNAVQSIGDFFGDVWDYISNPSKIIDDLLNKMGTIMGGNVLFDGLNNWLRSSLPSKLKEYIVGVFDSDTVKNNPSNPNFMPETDPKFIGQLAKYITSMYGTRKHPVTGVKNTFHAGIDLAGGIFGNGKPIYSQSNGNVITSGYSSTAGYWMSIQDGDKLYKYMHMQKDSLTKIAGEFVKAGEKIGLVGSTGRSTGPHLHFGVTKGGEPINPIKYFKGYGYKAFANGGIISDPTMALMGEAGQEAVVPLTQQKLKPFGQSVLNAIKEENANVSSDYGEITINLVTNLDGKVVAQQTAKFTKEELEKIDKRNNRRNGRK